MVAGSFDSARAPESGSVLTHYSDSLYCSRVALERQQVAKVFVQCATQAGTLCGLVKRCDEFAGREFFKVDTVGCQRWATGFAFSSDRPADASDLVSAAGHDQTVATGRFRVRQRSSWLTTKPSKRARAANQPSPPNPSSNYHSWVHGTSKAIVQAPRRRRHGDRRPSIR